MDELELIPSGSDDQDSAPATDHHSGTHHSLAESDGPSVLEPSCNSISMTTCTSQVLPFNFNQELALRIKTRLQSSRKDNPKIVIEIPFDELVFKGGLGLAGKKQRLYRGITRYTITDYSDLDHLLGKNWHFRGLNDKGDFCYAICESVCYYLKQMRSIVDYAKCGDNFKAINHIGGKCVVFMFVRGDGNRSNYDTYYKQ